MGGGLFFSPEANPNVIARSSCDEAIHTSLWTDGLLRGACHRARIRATRWLAMTAETLTAHYVAIGVGMVRNARVTCQNNCRLMASATEWAVPGRMMNWRSPFGSRL